MNQILAIAADSTGRTSLHDRAVAFRDLGRLCNDSMIPVVTKLAEPYLQPWLVWHGAMAALADCPFEQLAPWWRDMITYPRLPVRQLALVGLIRTGSTADLELVHAAMHRETDPMMRRVAGQADSLLRLPLAQRAVRHTR